MATPHEAVLEIRADADVVRVRQKVRELAIALGFTLIDQTKVITAASEIARNTLEHGQGGAARVRTLDRGGRAGLEIVFTDHGPGIPDVAAAMRDGFTTRSGMGLGLGGSKRLVNELSLETEVGKGTQVTLVKWKP